MPSDAKQPIGDEQMDFERRLAKILGVDEARLVAGALARSQTAATIIFGFAASLIAKKIAYALITAFLVYIGVPYIMMLLYATSYELPVFDVFDAMGDRNGMFCVIFLLGVIIQVVLILVPTWTWATDVTVRDMNWFESREHGDKSIWIRLRWAVAFIPGVITLALATLVYAETRILHDERSYAFNLGLVTLALVFLICFALLIIISLRFFRKISDQQPVTLIGLKSLCQRPGLLITTNTVSLMYVMFYATIAERIVKDAKLQEWVLPVGDHASVTITNSLVIFCSLSLLMICTIWVADSKSWMIPLAIPVGIFAMFTIFPGATVLLSGYMRMLRLGGDTPIIVAIDSNVARLWPEFFMPENFTSSDVEKPIRSGRLSLLLMGKEQIFLKNVKTQSSDAPSGTLMLNRSTVKEVMFPSSIPNKN